MEFGLIFILIVVAIVVGVGGAVVYAIAARGRQKQLSTKGGTLDAGREQPGSEDPDRPEHHEVHDEQRTRFVGTR